ncbi:Aldo/keto reductase [Polychytrium aggregatum]|uniref:Aldo/keto reductase n=1 Tax=Polychytrium aggregatum TaxID=110093 RepID=UPI0022FE7213|nr:Aldo/keto reductase [Polychytrium aggregatum]KAI9203020.1 Aldo/keto reductase [Polychytrium aggregatum]
MAQPTHPHVILGTMTFGTGVGGRINDLAVIQEILDLFHAHGHTEIDTARMYCQGNTEEVLAALNIQTSHHGFSLATKVYPFQSGDHEPEKLKATFAASLAALKTQKVDIFYLHAPDHQTPLEDTLGAVQSLYEAGHFKELGLSNYPSWKVMEIWRICKEKGYVLPTLYQGMYNAITREVEPELIPCIRHLGMRFYAYNPLCGGLLTGHYKFDMDIEKGSRFDGTNSQGDRYRQRYWNQVNFEAVEIIKAACAKHGVTPAEAAHRWLLHHSMLDQTKGDGIIIGISSVGHAKQNLDDCEKGALPTEVVDALDEAWHRAKGASPLYHR